MRNGENRSRAVGWRGVVLLGLVAWACSGKSRPFSDEVLPLEEAGDSGGGTTQGIDGAPVATPASPEGLAPNAPLDGQDGLQPGAPGSACTSNADCTAPNPCVDGVCCTSACTELCAACNVPGAVGTCSAAPADPACPALVCAGFDTECRTLDQTQLPLNCEAFAQCKLQASCASIPEEAGAACQAGAGSCDGAGACVVAGKAALGATCSSDVDCAEGHCVAGPDGALLCCDGACDGACQGCSAAGRCEVFPQQDERCEAVACPPDDVCRDYTADATASQCRSFGQCQTGRDCTFTALRPEAECACDSETGACALLAGAACGSSEQCQSGVCGANGQGATICCATACGAGLFCSSDGGGCVACEGDGVTCEGNTERRCNAGAIASTECPNGCTPGTGCNDLPPLGFTCDAGQCATPNVCQPDTTGRARCCSRDCAAEGKVCSENGSCVCQPGQVQVGADCLLADGDPCQNSEQCQVGSTCTDGVCCQEACAGACERCEPNTGACVAIAAGQQDPLCGVGRQCTGARGDCRLTVRQQCTGNGAECTTNNCEPTVGNATLICCAQACGADRPFCRVDGSACVQCETNGDCGNGCNTFTGLCNELRGIGTPCANSSECVAGAACVADGLAQLRCCERDCALTGQECNAQGRCITPLKQDGEACITGNECQSAVCTRWLADPDGDGVGADPSINGHPAVQICGDGSFSNTPPPLVAFTCRAEGEIPYVPDRGVSDCCENICPAAAAPAVSSATVFPGNTDTGTVPANCGPGVFTADFNCDGNAELVFPASPEEDVRPACNAEPTLISAEACAARSNGFLEPAECGVARTPQLCFLNASGACARAPAAAPPAQTPTCR